MIRTAIPGALALALLLAPGAGLAVETRDEAPGVAPTEAVETVEPIEEMSVGSEFGFVFTLDLGAVPEVGWAFLELAPEAVADAGLWAVEETVEIEVEEPADLDADPFAEPEAGPDSELALADLAELEDLEALEAIGEPPSSPSDAEPEPAAPPAFPDAAVQAGAETAPAEAGASPAALPAAPLAAAPVPSATAPRPPATPPGAPAARRP